MSFLGKFNKIMKFLWYQFSSLEFFPFLEYCYKTYRALSLALLILSFISADKLFLLPEVPLYEEWWDMFPFF
jgi:hypothetical protein